MPRPLAIEGALSPGVARLSTQVGRAERLSELRALVDFYVNKGKKDEAAEYRRQMKLIINGVANA